MRSPQCTSMSLAVHWSPLAGRGADGGRVETLTRRRPWSRRRRPSRRKRRRLSESACVAADPGEKCWAVAQSAHPRRIDLEPSSSPSGICARQHAHSYKDTHLDEFIHGCGESAPGARALISPAVRRLRLLAYKEYDASTAHV